MAGSRPPVAIPAAPLVGRAAEVDAASRFLADGFASFEPRAVVVRGDPGIGKTAIWRHLVESVGGDGTHVLAAAPTSAESELAYAGLADLIEAVPDDLIEALPGPQRHGLGVATLREVAGVEPLDPRTIGTAILGLVRTLASRSAVLIAIDDRQWLDRASADALVFALRRIVREPVAVLLSIRTDQDGAAVEDDDLTRLFGPDRTLQLEIRPLTAGALFQLLRNRLGHAFPRPTLIRIANWSGGNALLAIELGRLGLQPGGLIGAEAPSGLPRTVTAAVTRRLSSLPADERRSVLLAALAPELTATELGEAAGGLGWPWTLPDDPSIAHGEAGHIRLGHPLIASQAISTAPESERRAAHLALAGLGSDAVARARHMALGTVGPSESVATALDAAARTALARGATVTAIDLATLACDRTPPEAGTRRLARQRALGELLLRAGETVRAGEVLRLAAAAPLPGPERALARIALAEVASHLEGAGAAARLAAESAVDAGDDPIVAGQVELAMSNWVPNADDALAHARRAAELLGDGPLPLRAQASANLMASLSEVGETVPAELLDDALRLEEAARLEATSAPSRLRGGARATQAWLSLLADDLGTAHAQYEALRRRADEVGDEASLARILVDLAQIDLRWGRWAELETHAIEAIAVAERAGLERYRALGIIQLGAVAASRGDRAAAERHLGEALAFARSGGHAFIEAAATGNLGTLALAEGALEQAAELLEHAAAGLADSGLADVALSRFQGDRLEALVALGRIEEAVRVAAELEDRARRNTRRRPLALVARGRGLIAAEAGNLDLALSELDASVAALDSLDMPFEAARSRLARGIVQRRRRAKRLADLDLAEAHRAFEGLGARVWAARAGTERSRVGLRPRAPRALTETEVTVARLAADGRTSREIASAAFMSPRTVEGVLARVYAKLGIESRAELGAAMATLASTIEEIEPATAD